ncbi:unnamed protein product, partial [Symbiodinium microadriaticum]
MAAIAPGLLRLPPEQKAEAEIGSKEGRSFYPPPKSQRLLPSSEPKTAQSEERGKSPVKESPSRSTPTAVKEPRARPSATGTLRRPPERVVKQAPPKHEKAADLRSKLQKALLETGRVSSASESELSLRRGQRPRLRPRMRRQSSSERSSSSGWAGGLRSIASE